MERKNYLVIVDMDDQMQHFVDAATVAAQNSEREEVIFEHKPRRPFQMYKRPEGQELADLIKYILQTKGRRIATELEKYGLTLDVYKQPMLYELDQGWYTKEKDEVAVVVLLARGNSKIVVDPPGAISKPEPGIALVLPGADFQTDPFGVPFLVIPVKAKTRPES